MYNRHINNLVFCNIKKLYKMCWIFGFIYITTRPVQWVIRIPKSFPFYQKLTVPAENRRPSAYPAASYYKNNVTDHASSLHSMQHTTKPDTYRPIHHILRLGVHLILRRLINWNFKPRKMFALHYILNLLQSEWVRTVS